MSTEVLIAWKKIMPEIRLDILEYLIRNGKATAKEISKSIKRPIRSVQYNLKKLKDDGIVKEENRIYWIDWNSEKISEYMEIVS